MIAPRTLPPQYLAWNRRWRSPDGRASRFAWLAKFPELEARYLGPFAFQPNNSTRRFEYPWAYDQIQSRGSELNIVEIGGGLSGLQFVLASEGHCVVNVDPGPAAAGKGWDLDRKMFDRLRSAFRAPVQLIPTTIAHADLAENSADVLLCISVLEHFAPSDLQEFANHAVRILRPDGIAVLTADLFLDIEPFSRGVRNRYGVNVNLCELLKEASLELLSGSPGELYGYPEFSTETILANLAGYSVGESYPSLAQCIVAKPKKNGKSIGGHSLPSGWSFPG